MLKKVFFVCCAALAVASLPPYLKHLDRLTPGAAKPETDAVQTAALPSEPRQPTASYLTGVRSVKVPMDNTGHFSASFKVNGRTLTGLIDTGATYVAINQTMARSIGLKLSQSDFTRAVRTANGTTKAAFVQLARVEIGSISVSDIEAFVLEDAALSGTLIGMSFMSKLSSYKVEDRVLVLAD